MQLVDSSDLLFFFVQHPKMGFILSLKLSMIYQAGTPNNYM